MKKEDSRGRVRIKNINAETGCGHDGGREEKERKGVRA